MKEKKFSLRGANYTFFSGIDIPFQISFRNAMLKPIVNNKVSFGFILKKEMT